MKPLTYPARPINGGPLDKARPKLGGPWLYELKYNGWRALVHVPSGTMFNRQGQKLSIAGEFAAALDKLKHSQFEWLDCEALDRRHGLGRGSLIVLDEPDSTLPYADRPGRLDSLWNHLVEPGFATFLETIITNGVAELPGSATEVLNLHTRRPDPDSLYLPAAFTEQQARDIWCKSLLRQVNTNFGCDFYEGLVAKRADSHFLPPLNSVHAMSFLLFQSPGRGAIKSFGRFDNPTVRWPKGVRMNRSTKESNVPT
jgi:hypothetical protein